MLSHGNLVAGVKSLGSIAEVSCQPIKNNDVYIGYLPLAHVLELLAESCMLFLGVGIGYSSPNSLTDTSTMIMPGNFNGSFQEDMAPHKIAIISFIIVKAFQIIA